MTVAWLLLAAGTALLPWPGAARVRLARLAEQRAPVVSGAGPHRVRTVMPAARSGLGAVLVAVLVVGVAVTGGVVLALSVLVALGTGGWLARRAVRERASDRRARQLAAATGMLAAELEAGQSPAEALVAAGRLSPDHEVAFADAAAASRSGSTPQWNDDAELAALAHAWRLATDTGAPVAEAVRRAAGDLDAVLDQRSAVAGALAGARASAGLLAALPLLGLALGAAMSADPLSVLLHTPLGRLLTLIGVTLDCAGLVWTARLADHAARAGGSAANRPHAT